jgi:hypothetical protein
MATGVKMNNDFHSDYDLHFHHKGGNLYALLGSNFSQPRWSNRDRI